MKWVEVKVVFEFNDRRLAVDLISDVFYGLDLKGVVIEDSEVEGSEDWGSRAALCEHDAVIGYFPCDDTLNNKQKRIEEGLARLEKKIGIACRIFFADVDEADWAESWKAYFRPEKITERIIVKPTWRDYSQKDNEIVLEIDPGMAFGTGTHPTTRMCIALIEKYMKKNAAFLDVGTGSGILMVAAGKLGAGQIWGIDNDVVAAEIARKNLIHNQIPESVFKIITGDLVRGIRQRFDLVAANLTTKIISILLEGIHKVLGQDGIFICSGIPAADKQKIRDKLEPAGLEVIETLADEDWISMACRQA